MAAVLSISAIIGLVAGCETMGGNRNRSASNSTPGHIDPAAPEGAKGQAKAARLPGAWSSDAADIEKNLIRRNADANW